MCPIKTVIHTPIISRRSKRNHKGCIAHWDNSI